MSLDFDDLYGGTEDTMDVSMPFLDEHERETRAGTQRRSWGAGEAASGTDGLGKGGSGGSGGPAAAAAPPPPGEPAPNEGEDAERDDVHDSGDELEVLEDAPKGGAELGADTTLTDAGTPVSLRKTDHQEDAQSAATRGGSGNDSADDLLPRSAFRVSGIDREKQPKVLLMPEHLLAVLRAQLQSTAVRDLGVDPAAAAGFVKVLGQSSLIMAFLAAQLDLELELDPATQRAAELFRARDPLLGTIAMRMTRLEDAERDRADRLARMQDELREVLTLSSVIEQLAAYQVADREINFQTGSHDHKTVPITDNAAVYVRDRARELTRQQTDLEKRRQGRPIR